MLMCQMFLGCAHHPTPVSSTCVHLAICHFPQGWHTLSHPTLCLDVVAHACIPPATTQQAITALTHNIMVLPRDRSNMWPSSRSAELCGYCKPINATSVTEMATRNQNCFFEGSLDYTLELHGTGVLLSSDNYLTSFQFFLSDLLCWTIRSHNDVYLRSAPPRPTHTHTPGNQWKPFIVKNLQEINVSHQDQRPVC